jgi:hypothetical protein
VKLPLAARIAGLVLTVFAAAAVLAGCGGGSSSTATPSGDASGSASGAAGIQAYLSCLTQHRVMLPSRAPGAQGTRSPGARPSFGRAPRPSGSAGAGRFGGGGFPSGGFGGGGFGGGGFGGGGFGGGIFNDPSNPPAGVSASAWSAALAACKSLQPTAARRGNGRFNNSQFTAYANCLRSHGVTFSAGPNGLSTSDPKVAAALKTCAPLRPTGGVGPSGPPAPAPSATG